MVIIYNLHFNVLAGASIGLSTDASEVSVTAEIVTDEQGIGEFVVIIANARTVRLQ